MTSKTNVTPYTIKPLALCLLIAIFCPCTSTANTHDNIFTDRKGIITIHNPPITDIGRKVKTDILDISLSDDLGNLVRVEGQLLARKITDTKLKEGGAPALLDFFFNTGYFPATYGAIRPPSSIISRDYIEVNGSPVLFISMIVPHGSILEVDGTRGDSKRYFSSYLDLPLCVMVAFEVNTLDAKKMSEAEEKIFAQEKMTQVIQSISIDHSKMPKE